MRQTEILVIEAPAQWRHISAPDQAWKMARGSKIPAIDAHPSGPIVICDVTSLCQHQHLALIVKNTDSHRQAACLAHEVGDHTVEAGVFEGQAASLSRAEHLQ